MDRDAQAPLVAGRLQGLIATRSIELLPSWPFLALTPRDRSA